MRAKGIIVIIGFLVLSYSCSKENISLNLFKKTNKWKGEKELSQKDNYFEFSGEFDTYTYIPGLFKTFVNFELYADILTEKGGRATIAFHTSKRYPDQGYEVMIDNSDVGNWDNLLKTGSLNRIRNINYKMVDDNVWFNLKVKVIENHVQIFVNGMPVVDYIEPDDPFRTSNLDKRRLNAGTFSIRTLSGNTNIRIKDFQVIPLPRGEKMEVFNQEHQRQITELNIRNIPVVDYHVHKKGELTIPGLIHQSAELGINYGLAANCGLKFPIQTNEDLINYQDSIKGLPFFKAIQAEGREWVEMFDSTIIHSFDYVFTDAMTWTNKEGQRMRLWIPEETFVGDPEDFMEQLVSQIELIATEPISIYVNPTFLPVELADQYDILWTDDRIERVVKALKKNNVALELNCRYKIPGSRVIEKAKQEGLKFAMGTNNTSSNDLGKLDWALEMLEKHQLQPSDMFLPGEN